MAETEYIGGGCHPDTPMSPTPYELHLETRVGNLAEALEGVLDWATGMPGFHQAPPVQAAHVVLGKPLSAKGKENA